MRQLSEAGLDSRITPGELASRAAAVQTAGAIAELWCFTGDLPASGAVTGSGAESGGWCRSS
jgi:hypothetical protein